MNIDTIELGAGSYPDAPIEPEMKTVKVQCSFTTYLQVPDNLEYDEMKEYINTIYDEDDLLEQTDVINIDDII